MLQSETKIEPDLMLTKSKLNEPWNMWKVKRQDNVHYFPLLTTVAYIKMQEKINIFRQANLQQFRSSDLSPQSSS